MQTMQTEHQQQRQQRQHQGPIPYDDTMQRYLRLLTAGGLAGAVSRTATAPIDRLKMLLMVDNGAKPKAISWGIRKIVAEGSVSAYFKGNGTNVLKIAPETAIKLAMNDYLKRYVVRDPDNILLFERMICGGVAGGAAQFTIYPMELIKTRLATAPHGTYSGLMDAAVKVYQREGVFAFYRGLKPNMAGIFPYAGVEITCFEILFGHLNHYYDNNPPAPWIMTVGACSATLAQFISYPLSLVRTRLQAQGVNGAPRQYAGMLDCFQKTLRNEGYRGLYKGLLPNFLKLAPASGLSWFVFEWTKQFFGLNGQSSHHR